MQNKNLKIVINLYVLDFLGSNPCLGRSRLSSTILERAAANCNFAAIVWRVPGRQLCLQLRSRERNRRSRIRRPRPSERRRTGRRGCPGPVQIHRPRRYPSWHFVRRQRERIPAPGLPHPSATTNPRSHPEGSWLHRGSPTQAREQPTLLSYFNPPIYLVTSYQTPPLKDASNIMLL